jgi:hypothetical protein
LTKKFFILYNFKLKFKKEVKIEIEKILFGKLWWPVEARIEYINEINRRNNIILPLNTSIKNLRQLCDIGFADQKESVYYWDAVEQKYRAYHLVICQNASESMLVEAGKPYTTYANQTWKGIIP